MDVYTTLFCGCLLIAGGLIALVASMYGCLTLVNGGVVITEVLLAGCVVFLGIYLMLKSLPKLINAIAAEKDCEAPFYYELEPIGIQRRDLPPIPKNIGREYDPVILDRV